MSRLKILAKFLISGGSALLAATPISLKQNVDSPQLAEPRRLRPSELPIYDADDGHCGCSHGNRSQGSPAKESSALENVISDLIHSADEHMASLQSSKERVIDFLETGKAHTLGRKLIYSIAGASAAAAVCYPNEATQLTKSAYTISKYYAIVGYNKVQEELSSRRESKVLPKPVGSVDAIGEQKVLKPDATEQTKKPTPVKKLDPKGDYGQSNPEDRDMYTTRGK